MRPSSDEMASWGSYTTYVRSSTQTRQSPLYPWSLYTRNCTPIR